MLKPIVMLRSTLLLLVFTMGYGCLNAQNREEKLVAAAVESLRKAMVDPDKSALTRLTSVKLSYGHSTGRVEDQASFIESLVSGTSDFVSIKLMDQKIAISGNTAIVRHTLEGSTNDGGKPGNVKLGILLVWNQKGTAWQLLARQAVKLTQ